MTLNKILSCPVDWLPDYCLPRCWKGGYPCWPDIPTYPPNPLPLPKPWEDLKMLADIAEAVIQII